MSAQTVAFVGYLAFKFPGLLPSLEEHLQDNSGEVLPHLLMSNYCQIVCGADTNEEWVKTFLDVLEHNLSELDDDVSNLISVSFIESIHFSKVLDEKIAPLLGPRMRREYEALYIKDQ